MAPISFDGNSVTTITIDGTLVTEVTMDGTVVWTSSGLVAVPAPAAVASSAVNPSITPGATTTAPTPAAVASSAVNPSVTASSTVIIDSWESQSWADWDTPGDWTTGTTFVTDGTYGGEHTTSSGSTATSESGLNAYPQQGDIFKVDFQTSPGTSGASDTFDFRVGWAANTSTGERYEFHADIQNGDFELWERSPNNRLAVDSGVSWQDSTHYEVEVTWDDGTLGGSAGDMTLTLTNVDTSSQVTQISASDSDFTSGGVLAQAIVNNANEIYTDYWRITNR